MKRYVKSSKYIGILSPEYGDEIRIESSNVESIKEFAGEIIGRTYQDQVIQFTIEDEAGEYVDSDEFYVDEDGNIVI